MSQVIDHTMLIMFDTKANSNKFYEVTLDDAGDIVAKFGRVGAGHQTSYKSGGKSAFDKLIKSKLKKGYKEAQIEAISTPTGGVTVQTNVIDVALKQIKYQDDLSRALIEEIARENIHNITSQTNIKFDVKDGLFKTPLGVVRKSAVVSAEEILDKIESLLSQYDEKVIKPELEAELFSLNEDYFVLIPNRVANARDKYYLIFSQRNLEAQRGICKALFDTLDLIDDLKKRKEEEAKPEDEREEEKIFDVEIGILDDTKIFDEISSYYERSKNSMHGHNIMQSKVARVYKVRLGSQQQPFEDTEKALGNVHLLWHGTRIANILSIMGKGLLMPSQSPGQKAGAMFGNGLYFANQSSKSLQYSDGMYWASGSGKRNKIYMFLASVVVGKDYCPSGPTGGGGRPPAGYDSFWAKAGKSGVRNDEIIVFKGGQVRLDYLVEIEI